MEKIRIQRVYDEIIDEQGWSRYSDAKSKLLRNKFKFLVEDVLWRDINTVKSSGKIEVPIIDVPIIKGLLTAAVTDDPQISAWFNRKTDLTNAEQVVDLYSRLEAIVQKELVAGNVDVVTANEWTSVLKACVGASHAQKVIEMKQLLERLRHSTLPLDDEIGVGDVIVSDGDGHRHFAMTGKRRALTVEESVLNNLFNHASTASDYLEIVNTVLQHAIKLSTARSKELAEFFAQVKSINDLDDDSGDYGEEIAGFDDAGLIEEESVASEYLIRNRNLYLYLSMEPEIVKEIEAKAGTTGVLEFLKYFLM